MLGGLLALYRAAHLLGTLYGTKISREGTNRFEIALYWLNAAFDILISLGLFGAAILLDYDMRPLYEALGDMSGQERHKKRMIDAGQQLDSTQEKIPFALISPILRHYAQLTYVESENVATKREQLDRALNALQGEEPNIELAIGLLESAKEKSVVNNPEDIDLDVLRLLRVAYYRRGDAAQAEQIQKLIASLESLIQSRDFWRLAEHYKADSGDYLWALKIAADVSPSNDYSIKARDELSRVGIPIKD